MSFTISTAGLHSLASMATVVAPKKDITQVLEGVRVEVKSNTVTAYATDRYRAVKVTFNTHPDSVEPFGDVAVTIPRDPLIGYSKMLKAAKAAPGSPVWVTGVADETQRVVFTHEGAGEMQVLALAGNYPPVGKLFPTPDNLTTTTPEEGVMLNPVYVADAAKITHPGVVDMKAPMRMRFTSTTNPDKPGPVLFDRKVTDGTLEYLLQPNLNLR